MSVSAHRKVVTVLFCDVVGSTALGESVDPEALEGLLARYFERMKGIVLPMNCPTKIAWEPNASWRKSQLSSAFPTVALSATPRVRFRLRSGVNTTASTVSLTVNATTLATAIFSRLVQPATSPTVQDASPAAYTSGIVHSNPRSC